MSRGIDDLLFAGVKRVALRANVDMELLRRVCRAGLKAVSTCAGYGDLLIFRMYVCLHGATLDSFRVLNSNLMLVEDAAYRRRALQNDTVVVGCGQASQQKSFHIEHHPFRSNGAHHQP